MCVRSLLPANILASSACNGPFIVAFYFHQHFVFIVIFLASQIYFLHTAYILLYIPLCGRCICRYCALAQSSYFSSVRLFTAHKYSLHFAGIIIMTAHIHVSLLFNKICLCLSLGSIQVYIKICTFFPYNFTYNMNLALSMIQKYK